LIGQKAVRKSHPGDHESKPVFVPYINISIGVIPPVPPAPNIFVVHPIRFVSFRAARTTGVRDVSAALTLLNAQQKIKAKNGHGRAQQWFLAHR